MTAHSASAAPWRRSGAVTAVLIAALGAAMILVAVRHDRAEEIRYARNLVASRVAERAALVDALLRERLNNALVLAHRLDLDRLAMGDGPATPSVALQRQLDARIDAYQYHSLDVVGPDGRVRAHAGAVTDPALLGRSATAAGVEFVRGSDGRWWLSTVAPLPSGGALLLSSDPAVTFAPLRRTAGGRRVPAYTALMRWPDGALVPLAYPDHGGGEAPPDAASVTAAIGQVRRGHPAVVATDAPGSGRWLIGVRWLTAQDAALVGMLDADAVVATWQRRTWSGIAFATGMVLLIATLAAVVAARRERGRALERLQRDRAEQQRELRFQRLVENGTDLIGVVDGDFVLTYQSPSTRAVLGYDPEEMIGHPGIEWVHPDDRARLADVIAELVASPDATRGVQIRLRHRDGSWRDVAVSARNALAEAGIGGLILNGRDVTEEVAARHALENANVDLEHRVAAATEELRAANQALGEAAQSKDEFLASVSHELRTPLHAVLGIAESLQEHVYGPLGDRQLQAVRTIEASGRDLLALINDVLDVAKVEAGRLELDCQPLSVDTLCQSSLRLVREAAAKKHLTLDLRLDAAAPQVVGDGRRLKQVLVNLLGNAVKFTPDGGRIMLTTTADRETQCLEIAVRDSGIGIAATDLPKLFQPFHQIDSSLSRQHAGTGLGLALVRRLVELHGGSVAVESREGEGSCFTVSLPWDAGAATAAPAAAAPGPTAPVAVIADDSAAGLATLSSILRHGGYRVETAREGADAVALARAARPVVVVLGARLPGLDTLDVARSLRNDPALATLPIVVLAALVLPGDRERSHAAGVDLHLAKPMRPAVLLDRLAELLQDRAA